MALEHYTKEFGLSMCKTELKKFFNQSKDMTIPFFLQKDFFGTIVVLRLGKEVNESQETIQKAITEG